MLSRNGFLEIHRLLLKSEVWFSGLLICNTIFTGIGRFSDATESMVGSESERERLFRGSLSFKSRCLSEVY